MKKYLPKNSPPPTIFSYLFVIAIAGVVMALVISPDTAKIFSEKPEEVAISDILRKYHDDELILVNIKDQKITAEDKDGNKFEAVKDAQSNLDDLGLTQIKSDTKVQIEDTSTSKMWTNFFLGLLPFALIILLIMFFMRRSSGMGGGDSMFGFGKSRARLYTKSKHHTKFSDVAGADEAKEEVADLVDFLKHPQKYHQAGAKIPKGALLVGAPGTGKTLLARAIAGEAGVPFFSVSGSEFVEMFVGVGASRVRDLFKTATKQAPAIIFIDEIDAIGKHRGSGQGGGHDEREQTLNQILTEMDGFDINTSVIVIAATNRPQILDHALLRPGRFDRRVHIDLPDMKAREQILQTHSHNKKLAKNINLKEVASKTVGYSGADLENVMNEAAINAVKKRQKTIKQIDLMDAVEKVSMGPEKRSRRITSTERDIIAHHEVGHAIAGHLRPGCEPVHKISIISRGSALGATWFLPKEDTYLKSMSKMEDEIISLHGGRIAEELVFGETTTGASNDLSRATDIARAMITTYGMGDSKTIGPVVFTPKSNSYAGLDVSQREHGEDTARLIDQGVYDIIMRTEKICRQLLSKNLPLLKTIAKDLLKKETISREEFLAYFPDKKKT